MVSATLMAREMRAAARQPFTYNLRYLGAAALVLVCALSAFDERNDAEWGARVFPLLHSTLLTAIWVLVPLLAADCLSRERREKTLPLLFLTPLTPRQIVQAKGMAHGLRALTLWLAVVPVLAIAFMAGGVSWSDLALSLLLSFSSICLAMAAGLLASACAQVWMRALALAAIFAFLFLGGFILVMATLLGDASAWDPLEILGQGFAWAVGTRGNWEPAFGAVVASGPVSLPIGVNLPLLVQFGIIAAGSLAVLLLAVRLAAWRVSRTWRENPPPERVVRLRQRLCTPQYFKRFFQRWMRWELNRNPIGWLERRSWSARIVTWSWMAVFLCVYSSLLANLELYRRGFDLIQNLLAWLLILAVAISSAGSFRRERETGLLELLLVSPLREWQIIGGRLRGLWTQFIPAIFILLSCWLYLARFLTDTQNSSHEVLYYGAALLTLPAFGLYNSVARSNFPLALLGTLVLCFLVPQMLARIDDFLNIVLELLGQTFLPLQAGFDKSLLAMAIQLLLALACVWRLHRNLKRRKFALDAKPV
jgi:ABC-type transport system involved in multi-copper enzyme maturation permease subunit